MQFLRTLFWVMLAVIAVIFANKNWTVTPLNLWGGIVADVKLPVLLAIAFLAGLLPTAVLHQVTRWRARRRIEALERTVADLRPVVVPAMDAHAPFGADPVVAVDPATPAPDVPIAFDGRPGGGVAP